MIASVSFTIGFTTAAVIALWQGSKALNQGIRYLKRLHQIPCSRCTYFTGDYRLKCTVDPFAALTEAAIGCPDYHPAGQEQRISGCGGAIAKIPLTALEKRY
ncbi:MAG: hypothetical protein AAFQ61_07640 [Cyanobacteria bacterium J06626_23]